MSRRRRHGRDWPVQQARSRRDRRDALHQLAHLADERLALEGLGDVAVGLGFAGAGLVERLEGAGQQQHRDVLEGRIVLDRLADLVPVPLRHDHVGQDDIGLLLAGSGERVLSIVDGDDLIVLAFEGHAHDLLDRDGIIREKKGLGHGPSAQGGLYPVTLDLAQCQEFTGDWP
jgi:hypothetical protein